MSKLPKYCANIRNIGRIKKSKQMYDICYVAYVHPDAHSDDIDFPSEVERILNSDKSWSSVYKNIRFARVPKEFWIPGMLKITLVPNSVVSKTCSMRYLSCYMQNGFLEKVQDIDENLDHTVYINEANWNCTSNSCRNAGRTPSDPEYRYAYRYYVILHEVGHSLGFGHVKECPSPGSLAPIMLQQSVEGKVGNCKTNYKVYKDVEETVLESPSTSGPVTKYRLIKK